MNLKILTIFILIITFFSFFTFTFATEETIEEIQTITLIGEDSNTYKFSLYNQETDGNCFLYYNSSKNRLELYIFNKPVSRSVSGSNDVFKTLDGSTDNIRYFYYCTFDNTLGYFNSWNKGSTFGFSKETYLMTNSSLTFIVNYENTQSLKTPKEDKLILTDDEGTSYTLDYYEGTLDSHIYIFYKVNSQSIFFISAPYELTVTKTENGYQFSNEEDTTARLTSDYYNLPTSTWKYLNTRLSISKWNGTENFSGYEYKYIGYFPNSTSLRKPVAEEPDTPIEPEEPDIPTEPDEPDTPTEPDDPNEEIVIDPTEINNNLTKIYTGIQFIVSFLSLGAVILLIYIVYKLFSIFFPF